MEQIDEWTWQDSPRSGLSPNIMRLSTLHRVVPAKNMDRVWGCVLEKDNRQIVDARYRVITLWGRRLGSLRMQLGDWTDYATAWGMFDNKVSAQRADGYEAHDWRDKRYGMQEAIKQLLWSNYRQPPTPEPEAPTQSPERISGGAQLRKRRSIEID